jgi:hypothetical protein
MAEGCKNAMALWRDLCDHGFAGTHRQVHRFVAKRRAKPVPRTARKWLPLTRKPSAEFVKTTPTPSPKQLAWILVQPATTQPPRATADLARIRQDAEAARVADSAPRYTMLIHACGLDNELPANWTNGSWRPGVAVLRRRKPSRPAWRRTGRRFRRR